MNAKESVASYCKAQAEINKIEKNNENERKALNERIKTCRSLITDELTTKSISCLEVNNNNDNETMYFRLKPTSLSLNPSIDDIVFALNNINTEVLNTCAERCGHDLPKMISTSIHMLMRNEKKNTQTEEKNTLTISSNRERGYNNNNNNNISSETMQVARDLLAAKKELTNLKQKQSTEKKKSITVQKEVEANVKDALRASDPQNKTTRVHMMQDQNEWVYYLRCKESKKATPMGIRKVVSMIETVVTQVLDNSGLSREYNSTYNLGQTFWNSIHNSISEEYNRIRSETKTVSKLSLDRGAPRTRQRNVY